MYVYSIYVAYMYVYRHTYIACSQLMSQLSCDCLGILMRVLSIISSTLCFSGPSVMAHGALLSKTSNGHRLSFTTLHVDLN